jgi:hypothetical protein
MTNNNHGRHPDLLRRFVPTPYVFNQHDGPNRLCIQSNDLGIALAVRRSSIVQRCGEKPGGLFCQFIRDVGAPVADSEVSVLSDGPLRVLSLGPGTILIYDHERSELLGFVSCNVKLQTLISSLIPTLLNPPNEERVD